ncbi:hypothetical protein HQ945_03185 [Phyllobacterium sp. BT25]|uniref:Sulfotransferase family protein n=1 Tax=Phyllobacterium pellucidum TaxID=2740464 RepID=A0A849VK67_9HYPH|nr:hypothetical protein [Phyllobacterium pellucidum]NTS30248.1 hypothetical protein [Phyllobacterium pellucidum]
MLIEKSCYVHVGLHKTGTTALQNFLQLQQSAIEAAGFLYPRACRAMSGHHLAAWVFMNDPRAVGTASRPADLVAEMLDTPLRNILLSSEDFEGCLVENDGFYDFLDDLQWLAIKPKIVIYLRRPADYAESLYLELLKHGFRRSFSEYLEEILDLGFLQYESWIFWFDYERVSDGLSKKQIETIIRPYPLNDTIDDFCRTVGLSIPGVPAVQNANVREDVGTAYKRFADGAELDRQIDVLAMSPVNQARFDRRFVFAPTRMKTTPQAKAAVYLEDIFKRC